MSKKAGRTSSSSKRSPIVCGQRAVAQWLRYGRVRRLYISNEQAVLPAVAGSKVPRVTITPGQMRELCGSDSHQHIAAEVTLRERRGMEEVRALFAQNRAPLLVCLDGVNDPHNLGALIRTAAALGVDALVLPTSRAVSLTPTVHKVACGGTVHLPCVFVANIAAALREMRQAGCTIVGADETGALSLASPKIAHTESLCWVLGGEERGLRANTKRHCDWLVKIPTADRFDCLNLSVAGAICLFETYRNRNKRQSD